MQLHFPSVKEDLRKIGVGLVLGGLAGWFLRSNFTLDNVLAILIGTAFIFIGSNNMETQL